MQTQSPATYRIFAALDLKAAAYRRQRALEMTSPHDQHMRRRMLDNARFMIAEARYSRIKAAKLAHAQRLEKLAANWELEGEPLLASIARNAARVAFRDYYETRHPGLA